MHKRPLILLSTLLLAGCVSADPSVVAHAVGATLTAAITPTPIVIVVTALGGGPIIPTVTLAPTQAPPSATPTAPESATPAFTSTPTLPPATNTAAPSPTRAPSPTVPTPVPLTHGAAIFTDDFTDPTLWTLVNDNVQRTTVENGKFVFTIKTTDQYRFVYNSKRRAGDFVATLSASTAACRFRDRYGLLFRVRDGNNYYQFDVDCNGSYRISKVVGGGLIALQNWQTSTAVRNGPGPNELTVRAEGKLFQVYASGQLLASLTDSTFTEGGFGLIAGSGLSETYTVEFDQLNVWQVK